MKAKELAYCSLKYNDYYMSKENSDVKRQYNNNAYEITEENVTIVTLFTKHCRVVDQKLCNCIYMLKSIVELMSVEEDPYLYLDEYYAQRLFFPTINEISQMETDKSDFRELYNETMLLRLFEFSIKYKCPILYNEFILYYARRTNRINIFWLFKLVNHFKKPVSFFNSIIEYVIMEFVPVMEEHLQKFEHLQEECRAAGRQQPNLIEYFSFLFGLTDYFDTMENLCLLLALQHKDVTRKTDDYAKKIQTIQRLTKYFYADEKKYLRVLKMAPTTSYISNSKLFKYIDFTEIQIDNLYEMYLQKNIDPYVMENVLKMRVTKEKASYLDPPIQDFPVLRKDDLPFVEHGHNYKAPEYINMSKAVPIFSLPNRERYDENKDRQNKSSRKTFNKLYLFVRNQDTNTGKKATANPEDDHNYVNTQTSHEGHLLDDDQYYSLHKIDKIINIGIFNYEHYVREYNKKDM